MDGRGDGKLRSGVTGMMEQHGVKTMQGVARFRDGKTVEVTGETGTTLVRADHVVIATGSRPVELPGLPTGGKVLDSTAALALNDVPDRIAVIGAGYIGLELGTAFAKLGAQVTLIEAADALLPQYDRRLTSSVVKRLGALGVTLMTDTRVTGWDEGGGTLDLEGARGKSALEVDNVLVTVGRTANTDGLGLEELQLRMTGAFIRIDDECRTSMRGSMRSGTLQRGPCWPTAPPRRRRWSRISLQGIRRHGTSPVSQPCASPTPRS